MNKDQKSNYKIFLSHRSTDNDRVKDLLRGLTQVLPNFPIENISDKIPFDDGWKTIATKLLEKSDGFVCIVGEDTYQSEPVNWEIQEAHRLGKPIIITTLSDKYLLPPACVELQIEGMPWNTADVASRIGELLIPRALFVRHDWNVGTPEISTVYNQYNLMVQSWESLIARRQTVNTLYISADSALLAGIGALISSVNNIGRIWTMLGIAFLAFLGIVLSFNWRRTILSYGTLSRAKSKVVAAMETFMPAKLFDTEWRVLETNKYKSTTETDKQTAFLFLIIFLIISITACVMAIVQLIRM